MYLPVVASWDAQDYHSLDYRLVQNTFVRMFWQPSILDETVKWLREHMYAVVSFDASLWTSLDAMFDSIAQGLAFPDYFGRNLDALNDCMRDVARCEYGWTPDAMGLVIVLRAFDSFVAISPGNAQVMLDIFANQARSAILIGNRIICLVQTNDAGLAFEPVGAMPVVWNPREWLDSKRGF